MSEIFQEPSAEQRTLQPLANKNRQRKKNDSTNYLLCVAKFAVIWYKIGKHMLFLFYVFLVLFQFVSKCGCYVCPMFPMFYFYQTQWKPNFFNIILQPHHLYMGVLEGVFAGVPCWAEGLNIYIYIYGVGITKFTWIFHVLSACHRSLMISSRLLFFGLLSRGPGGPWGWSLP